VPARSATRIYAALLALYPRDFRIWFADEMQAAFDAALTERRLRSRAAARAFAARECAGVLAAAAVEWIDKRRADRAIRGRSLPDPTVMRPPGLTRAEHYVWR
jgi:hypothetical protein